MTREQSDDAVILDSLTEMALAAYDGYPEGIDDNLAFYLLLKSEQLCDRLRQRLSGNGTGRREPASFF